MCAWQCSKRQVHRDYLLSSHIFAEVIKFSRLTKTHQQVVRHQVEHGAIGPVGWHGEELTGKVDLCGLGGVGHAVSQGAINFEDLAAIDSDHWGEQELVGHEAAIGRHRDRQGPDVGAVQDNYSRQPWNDNAQSMIEFTKQHCYVIVLPRGVVWRGHGGYSN